MSIQIKNVLMSSDAVAPTTPAGSMSVDDMVDFMKDDTPDKGGKIDLTKTDKPDAKDDKKDDKDDDDLNIKIEDDDDDDNKEVIDEKESEENETDDEELDEIDDDKLELVDHVSRKEILKQFPDLFKKFPYLERAYYRNLQFTELFSKPEEAKAAVEAQQTLNNFETQLLSGDVKEILKAVKEENQESFHKLVDNYLGTLEEVDPKMWEHVVGNLNKQTVFAMFQEGKRTDNKELMKAALHLNQFIFGTSEYTPPVQLSKPVQKTDKEKELEDKEKSFNQKVFETHRNTIETKVSNSIKNTIELNIDPKGTLDNQFVKDKAIEDAMTNLNKLMNSDTKYIKNIKTLWEDAAKNDYKQPYLDKIKSATINKARTLIKGVIKDTRNKVFKNSSSRNNEDKGSRKGPLPQGKPAAQNSGSKKSESTTMKEGESAIDFMLRD